jgi:hypothetical protein
LGHPSAIAWPNGIAGPEGVAAFGVFLRSAPTPGSTSRASCSSTMTIPACPWSNPTMLVFPNAPTIDAFNTGGDVTPSLMQYQTTGPFESYGWYPIASLGGTLSPW